MRKTVLLAIILSAALLMLMPRAYASGSDSRTLYAGVETSLYWGEHADQGTKTWSTSNSGIVSLVGSSGNDCYIKAVAPGSCTVIAEVEYQAYETQWIPYPWGGGYWGVVLVTKTDSFTYNITVVEPGADEVANITIDAGSPTVGDVYLCTVSLKTASGGSLGVLQQPVLFWSSSNASVATVNSNGVIEAKKVGTAVITAQTLLGTSGSCTVQVGDFSGYTAVSTASQLSDIRNAPDGNYYLTGDIVFSDEDFQPGGQFYNDGAGFIPIPRFYGVLNGNGHSIVNLHINTAGRAGLALWSLGSDTTTKGQFKNLEIRDSTISGKSETGAFSACFGQYSNCRSTNCTISGNVVGGIGGTQIGASLCVNTSTVNGKNSAGGIAGTSSTVKYCANSGSVQAIRSMGDTDVGGAGGIIGYGGTVLGCINTGDVKGNSSSGGIIGGDGYAIVRFCVNSGNITVSAGPRSNCGAGGIAGWVGYVSKVYDCYNTGSVGADAGCTNATIGGICGTMQEDYADSANNRLDLYNCYNAGQVTSSYPDGSYYGGIAGSVYNSKLLNNVLMVKNCYYSNAAAAGIGRLTGMAENITALSTSQMQAASSYAGFDFDNSWFIAPGDSYAYPKLTCVQMKDSLHVSFNSQGGSGVALQTSHYNMLIAPPAAPAKTGYAFTGWYREPACTTAWNFEADRVKCDITLYAKWTANAYTVTFNCQGGSEIDARLALYGSTITAPPSPTRSNYIFGRWYKEAACKNLWNFATDKVTADLTLYTKWYPSTLAVPASVKAISASYSSIKVSWNAVSNAAGYEVWRASSSNGTYTRAGIATTTSFTHTGLATAKIYYYKVRAYLATGVTTIYSGYSSIISAKPVPAIPASVKAAQASYNSIKVTWAAVTGASKYEVYRSTLRTGTYSLITTTATLSYTNTSVKTGTTYYYKVRAYRIVGSAKVYSAFSSVVYAKTALVAPTSVRAIRISSKSIKLTWGAVAGATKYELWRCTTSASGTFSLYTTVSGKSYTNTRLTTGKTYYYKIRAYRLVSGKKVYGKFSSVVRAKP